LTRRDHLGCGRALGEAGEVADVEEHHRYLDLLAGERGPFAQDVLCDLLVDIGPERFADPLALREPLRHAIESRLQQADLARVIDCHTRVEVALLDTSQRAAHRGHRIRDRARSDQDRDEPDRDRNNSEKHDRRECLPGTEPAAREVPHGESKRPQHRPRGPKPPRHHQSRSDTRR